MRAQQTDNGSFAGVVTDPEQKAVPGATVTVANLGTGLKRTATTGEDGRWTIAALSLGTYSVKAEAPGFKKVQKATVTASTATTVEF